MGETSCLVEASTLACTWVPLEVPKESKLPDSICSPLSSSFLALEDSWTLSKETPPHKVHSSKSVQNLVVLPDATSPQQHSANIWSLIYQEFSGKSLFYPVLSLKVATDRSGAGRRIKILCKTACACTHACLNWMRTGGWCATGPRDRL